MINEVNNKTTSEASIYIIPCKNCAKSLSAKFQDVLKNMNTLML